MEQFAKCEKRRIVQLGAADSAPSEKSDLLPLMCKQMNDRSEARGRLLVDEEERTAATKDL